MASPAYKDNGVIIIWWDESEDGDGLTRTIPEIIISPLAKGNAYASSVPLNHSSDLKTVEEIFGLPAVNNPIPVTETDATGIGYNNFAIVNDLSDLFVPGAIPATPSVSVTRRRLEEDHHTHHVFLFVDITNVGTTTVPAPLFLVLDNLGTNATLLNAAGTTTVLAPLGSPCVSVSLGDDDHGFDRAFRGDDEDGLRPRETRTVILEFLDPSGAGITYDTRVLSVTPAP